MSFSQSKLIKLMQLTTSPFDGEALNAIRKANAELAEADITWEDILKNKEIIIKQVTQIIKKEPNPEIEHMLNICIHNVRSTSGKAFVKSLQTWYKEKGFLTKKQEESLRRWYGNI